MPGLSVSVEWFASASVYRARFRGPGIDIKRRVPEERFTEQNMDPHVSSKNAEKVAWLWAAEEKPKIEATLTRKILALQKSPLTLEQLFTLYREKNPNSVSPVTMRKNEEHAAALLNFFNAFTPAAIDRSLVLDYIRFAEGEGFRNRTIRNRLFYLKHVLEHGYEWRKETGMDAIGLLRLPTIRKQGKRGRALTVDEFASLLRVELHRKVDTERVHRVMIVGVTTMLRRNVLLKMRHEWVNKKRKWLTIPEELMKGVGGSKRELSVPLSDWAMEAIGKEYGEWVFPNPQTFGPTKDLRLTLRALAKAAGIEEFTLHDLRRTGTTWLADRGVPRLVRKILLGHAVDADVTDLYTFTSPEELRRSVAIFDAIKEELHV